MSSVSAKQLMVRSLAGGRDTYDAVDTDVSTDPWALADEASALVPKKLGTSGLLRLAAELIASGFRVSEIDLRGTNFAPLSDEHLDEELQKLLKQLLTSGDRGRGASSILLNANAILVDVKVRKNKTAFEVVINRDGRIDFNPPAAEETLLESLLQAVRAID